MSRSVVLHHLSYTFHVCMSTAFGRMAKIIHDIFLNGAFCKFYGKAAKEKPCGADGG